MPAEPPPSRQVTEGPRREGRRARADRLGDGRALVIRSAIITTALAIAATALGVALVAATGTASRVPSPTRAAGQFPAVGALFTTQSGRLMSHFCSATVVDSPSGDLVLTAAHCVAGPSPAPAPVVFVPGYANGRAPYGVWTITRIIVDQQWQASSDPANDFAFLVVRRTGSTAVQNLTGAEAVGIGQPPGQMVTVTGYPSDIETPIRCDNDAVAFSQTQLEFECNGYTNGTSGGPFLANDISAGGPGIVIGVIGGYEQGGVTASVSYAARFGPSMAALYRTAIAEAGP